MIFSYLLLLFLLLFFIFIHANEQFHLGIINHNIQWHIYCPQNNTRIINPPINDQPLITYQCPYGSLPIEIVPIEVDFTFLCRLQSRLVWIIVDVYQYNDWLWSKDIEQLNISIKLNQEIQIKDFKNEINNYKNRFIIINAFYIPFESLDIILNKKIEISIRINQCIFSINENSTWNDIIHQNWDSVESKTLHVQHAQCDFFPKLVFQKKFFFFKKIFFRSIPIDTNQHLQVDNFDDNTTNVPDFHVVLSIDGQKSIETTTTMTTTAQLPDYHLLFNEHYQKILSALVIIKRTSNLITFIFIFTIIILVLLIIFFIYILCYHHHHRSIQKSSLLI